MASAVASAVIGRILPPPLRAAETFADIAAAPLFAAEETALAGAGRQRRAEFATGRACARAALAGLGVPAVPIVPGACGEPRWPAGTTGSITHCAGYRACAVGPAEAVAAVGIDAEPNLPLPGGLLAAVASRAERGWLADRMTTAPWVCWDRLVFSAKESVYKAWFSLTGRRLPLTNRTLARMLVRYPIMTAKVTTLIHLQGLRLHRRGVAHVRRPHHPKQEGVG